MIISKIKKPFLINLSFQAYEDFLWTSTVTVPGGYTIPPEYVTLGYPLDEYNTTPTELGGVYVDNIEYVQVDSIASCKAIEKSFYFNIGAQVLYIHADHEKRMHASDFDSLETRGYSNDQIFYDSNDIKYEPLLSANIKISDEVDRIIYSTQSFVTNSLDYINQFDENTDEGEFDYSLTTPVPGATVDVLYISQEDLDADKKTLTNIYQGFVGAQKIEDFTYSQELNDKREQLNGKYPNTVFDSATYTLMSDGIGELIPEGYGSLIGTPAFCINDTITSGDVLYKYGTDGTTLTTVYVKIEDAWTAVTPTASSGTACTYTLATGDGRDSSGNPRESKVDAVWRAQVNPANIIIDLLSRAYSIPFNNDFFDFGSWSDESSIIGALDGPMYLDKRQEFFKWIGTLQNGAYPFIFRVNPTGKFWIKADDITRAVKKNFTYLDNLNDSRPVETDFTQYATDVEILYSKDQESGKVSRETIDTYKDETLDVYRIEQEIQFDTLLTSQADAQTRGDLSLKDYKIARPLHSISIRGIQDIELLDVVTYDSSIYFDGVKHREYNGVVKLKIAMYEYDFAKDDGVTNLKGYDISDIVSKGTFVTSQGVANGTTANGLTTVNGPTTTYQQEAG